MAGMATQPRTAGRSQRVRQAVGHCGRAYLARVARFKEPEQKDDEDDRDDEHEPPVRHSLQEPVRSLPRVAAAPVSALAAHLGSRLVGGRVPTRRAKTTMRLAALYSG